MRKKIPRRGEILTGTSKSQDFSDFFFEKKFFLKKYACANAVGTRKRKRLINCIRITIIHGIKKSQTKRNFGPSLHIRYSDLSIEKLWNVIAHEWLYRNRFQIQYSNTLSTSFRLSLFLALNSKFWNRAIWLVEN